MVSPNALLIPYRRTGSLIVRHIRGRPSREDLERAVLENYTDPTPDVCWIVTPEGALGSLTGADLRMLAMMVQQLAEARRGGRTALVAPGDLEFGMSRIVESLSELLAFPFDVRSFRQPAEAAAWLEVDPGLLEPEPPASA